MFQKKDGKTEEELVWDEIKTHTKNITFVIAP